MKLNLSFVESAVSGKVQSKTTQGFIGVGTDTRVDLKNQLFVALKGDRFDAHDFLEKAADQGATGALIHRWDPSFENLKSRMTLIQVPDTLRALQDLARAYRRQCGFKVVGITGSNGKTTSKEFTAAVLSSHFKVHASKGSFNNHWGVPLTLLQAEPSTQVCICEMGMNHAGEITELVKIAEPNVVVCTMVGRAHIEHFGTVDGIAAAKEEIYGNVVQPVQAIFNLDNPWTRAMADRATSRKMIEKIWTFSAQDNSDVKMKIKAVTPAALEVDGEIAGIAGASLVPIFGVHNLTNLQVAASVALVLGMTPKQIWENLKQCKTNWGRNQFIRTRLGAQILFDGYNANPDSMKALFENASLLKVSGRRMAVVAEMLELGDLRESAHQELGQLVGSLGLDRVWFYGPSAKNFEAGMKSAGFKNNLVVSSVYEDSLAKSFASVLQEGDVILVKGSRGMQLERFVLACDPLDFSKNKND